MRARKLPDVWLPAFRVLVLLRVLACQASAQTLEAFEPTPFRRNSVEGRGFVYNEDSFLHRMSYHPMPLLGRLRPLPDRTFVGTAGSTSNNELYAVLRASIRFPMDGPFFADYSFRRDEDFDGRFDQNLIGFGLAHGPWQAAVRGDVEADKGDIDIHADLRWDGGGRNDLRLTWVAPDALLNQKNQQDNYDVTPYTYFVQGTLGLPRGVAFRGFGQINTPANLVEDDLRIRTESRDHSMGFGLEIPLSPSTRLEVFAEFLRGRRSRESLAESPAPLQELDRAYDSQTAELRTRLDGGEEAWIGLRHLRFSEDDVQPDEPDDYALDQREENTLYLGRTRRINARLTFAPTIFLAYHRNRTAFPLRAEDSEYVSNQFRGKFSPALDLVVNRETGARMVFVANTLLHRANFGGGNVQVLFPF